MVIVEGVCIVKEGVALSLLDETVLVNGVCIGGMVVVVGVCMHSLLVG